MKIAVKTLRGTSFEIDVEPQDKIAEVKKTIEAIQGHGVYPSDRQLLIHHGKILNDDTTLDDNKFAADDFLVVMLSKAKVTPTPSGPSYTENKMCKGTGSSSAPSMLIGTLPSSDIFCDMPCFEMHSDIGDVTNTEEEDEQALREWERAVKQLFGLGQWGRENDDIENNLSAATDRAGRNLEYTNSGAIANMEPSLFAQGPAIDNERRYSFLDQQPVRPDTHAPVATASTRPNTSPLNLFPPGLPGASDDGTFNIWNPEFRRMLILIRDNPDILEALLDELDEAFGQDYPDIIRIVRENHAQFIHVFLNPPPVESIRAMYGQFRDGMPEDSTFTPEELEVIGQLEAMGFDRALVLEALSECNNDEEIALNYLMERRQGTEPAQQEEQQQQPKDEKD